MGIRRQSIKENIYLRLIDEPTDEIIEALYNVEISAHITPWSYDDIRDCFTDNTKCIALYVKKELVGFAIICLVYDEAELYTIGIMKKYQGLGFGHHLLFASLKLSAYLGAKKCFLEVRVSNETAIYLYDLYGFEISGIRKNYYAATAQVEAENAYTMVCDLTKLQNESVLSLAPNSRAKDLKVNIEFAI